MNQRAMEGQTVYDENGNEVGTVREVRGRFVKVDVPMAPDYWVRVDAVSAGTGNRLMLMSSAEHYDNPDSAEVDSMATTRGGRMETTERTRANEAESLELREERLRVEKEREQAGEVHLGKRVTEHEETVNVPLREERVVIERHPVEGQRASGEIRETDEEIEIPLTRERANVEKEAVVREEVTARKEATERTEGVQATLRREELDVQEEGDVRENPNVPRTGEYQREETRRG